MKPVAPVLVAAVLLLSGCAATRDAGASPSGTVRVVASTDVWGDIVKQIGGSAVSVDSIVSDPDRDPHEYQADPRDQLAVSRARLVVVNGGGYDDFLGQLVKHAPAGTEVVDAADASGLDTAPATGELNEHLWYDFDVVAKVAGVISADLTILEPSKRALFDQRLASFRAALSDLSDTEASIKASASGEGVAITEPVPLYLTTALGLVNRTPAAFSSAVEDGNDVAPAVLRAQLALFSEHRVEVLVYNEQTTGATTEQVLAAAKAARIPAVGVRETLPAGQDYLELMRHDVMAMRTALAR